MKSAKMSAIVLAVAVAGMASMSVARADEAQARSLLKAMSDYLAAQKTISFDYDIEPRNRQHTAAKNWVGQFRHLDS